MRSKWVLISITLLFIVLISSVDYITGTELSFSIFYLIPLSIYSLNRSGSRVMIVTFALISSVLWFWVEWTTNEYTLIFFPIWNASVRFFIFIGFGLLLHFYQEKQMSLISTNARLKALNEEKNRYVGIAAHDLRSPINGIFGLSDILLHHPGKEGEMQEIVGMIRKLSENMLVLIKNLLDVSQIESGKIVMSIKSQDYITFIREHIHLNQMMAKKKGITIDLNCERQTIVADFDEHYMSEVVNNLLSNAIKYSNKESRIIVSVSLQSNGSLLTEVIDEGQGIREEEQQRLFTYFQKTSTLPTAGEQSTGLGLAIAKKIVTSHHGQIGVKSVYREGANFYFSFPLTENRSSN